LLFVWLKNSFLFFFFFFFFSDECIGPHVDAILSYLLPNVNASAFHGDDPCPSRLQVMFKLSQFGFSWPSGLPFVASTLSASIASWPDDENTNKLGENASFTQYVNHFQFPLLFEKFRQIKLTTLNS